MSQGYFCLPFGYMSMGKILAEKATVPLFPGGTAFAKVGKDFSDVTQRWGVWISERLWPEWEKFSTGNNGQDWIKMKMGILANPNPTKP
jgi:hypothetical protein